MPVKSFEQVLTEEAARKQQLDAQRQARREQIDYFAQIEQQRVEQQAVWNHEHELLVQRIQYGHEHSREIDRSTIPKLDGIYQQIAAQEQAAEQAAEAARIAALTPHDLWISTLSYGNQQKVLKWESINKRDYPVQQGLD